MSYTLWENDSKKILEVFENFFDSSKYSLEYEVKTDSEACDIKFYVFDKTVSSIYINIFKHYLTEASSFRLVELINCCGVLVSTQTYVYNSYRGKGIAQKLMPFKEEIAKILGYSLLMATVDIGNNPAEVHILEKFGWENTQTFLNKRTNHTLGVFTKEV